jgi:glycine/D-amino acid oxidase-like deaminating enzyme
VRAFAAKLPSVGLTVALYLARYGRDAVVVDDSASRARLIPQSASRARLIRQATTIRASRASPDPISWRGCVSRHSCMAPL